MAIQSNDACGIRVKYWKIPLLDKAKGVSLVSSASSLIAQWNLGGLGKLLFDETIHSRLGDDVEMDKVGVLR